MPIHQLSVRNAFDGLTVKEKLYAHYMSKAAWSGARIILRQVSPEANDVFDLIMELHKCCQARLSGRWADIGAALNVSTEEVDAFLNFAANFLSNVGNYYVSLPSLLKEMTLKQYLGIRRPEDFPLLVQTITTIPCVYVRACINSIRKRVDASVCGAT